MNGLLLARLEHTACRDDHDKQPSQCLPLESAHNVPPVATPASKLSWKQLDGPSIQGGGNEKGLRGLMIYDDACRLGGVWPLLKINSMILCNEGKGRKGLCEHPSGQRRQGLEGKAIGKVGKMEDETSPASLRWGRALCPTRIIQGQIITPGCRSYCVR